MTLKTCFDLTLPLAFVSLLLTAASVSADPINGNTASEAARKEEPKAKTPTLSNKPPSTEQLLNAHAEQINGTLQAVTGAVNELKASVHALIKNAETKKPSAAQAQSNTAVQEVQARLLGIDVAVLLFALIIGPLMSWLVTRATLRNAGLV